MYSVRINSDYKNTTFGALEIGDNFVFKYEVSLFLKLSDENNKTPLKAKQSLLPNFTIYEKTGKDSYQTSQIWGKKLYYSFYKRYIPKNVQGYTIKGAEVVRWTNRIS